MGRYLPAALQRLDDEVTATVNAINGFEVGLPNPQSDGTG